MLHSQDRDSFSVELSSNTDNLSTQQSPEAASSQRSSFVTFTEYHGLRIANGLSILGTLTFVSGLISAIVRSQSDVKKIDNSFDDDVIAGNIDNENEHNLLWVYVAPWLIACLVMLNISAILSMLSDYFQTDSLTKMVQKIFAAKEEGTNDIALSNFTGDEESQFSETSETALLTQNTQTTAPSKKNDAIYKGAAITTGLSLTLSNGLLLGAYLANRTLYDGNNYEHLANLSEIEQGGIFSDWFAPGVLLFFIGTISFAVMSVAKQNKNNALQIVHDAQIDVIDESTSAQPSNGFLTNHRLRSSYITSVVLLGIGAALLAIPLYFEAKNDLDDAQDSAAAEGFGKNSSLAGEYLLQNLWETLYTAIYWAISFFTAGYIASNFVQMWASKKINDITETIGSTDNYDILEALASHISDDVQLASSWTLAGAKELWENNKTSFIRMLLKGVAVSIFTVASIEIAEKYNDVSENTASSPTNFDMRNKFLIASIEPILYAIASALYLSSDYTYSVWRQFSLIESIHNNIDALQVSVYGEISEPSHHQEYTPPLVNSVSVISDLLEDIDHGNNMKEEESEEEINALTEEQAQALQNLEDQIFHILEMPYNIGDELLETLTASYDSLKFAFDHNMDALFPHLNGTFVDKINVRARIGEFALSINRADHSNSDDLVTDIFAQVSNIYYEKKTQPSLSKEEESEDSDIDRVSISSTDSYDPGTSAHFFTENKQDEKDEMKDNNEHRRNIIRHLNNINFANLYGPFVTNLANDFRTTIIAIIDPDHNTQQQLGLSSVTYDADRAKTSYEALKKRATQEDLKEILTSITAGMTDYIDVEDTDNNEAIFTKIHDCLTVEFETKTHSRNIANSMT